MSDTSLKIQVLLDTVDRLTAPFNAALGASKRLDAGLSQTRAELKKVNDAMRMVDGIKRNEQALKELGTSFGVAQAKAQQLAKELRAVGPPTEAQTKAFAKAREEAAKLKDRYEALRGEISQQKDKLAQTAAGTRDLELADRKLAIAQTQAKRAVNEQTAALAKQAETQKKLKAIQDTAAKVNNASSKLTGAGMSGMVSGAAMSTPFVAAIKGAAQFETAMLGVARQVDGARDANGNYTQTYYEMGDALRKLSERLPMAANDMAALAAAAARNGVQGKDNILAVTEVAAKASMAFDLPVEQLGDDLSKIAMLYKIPIPAIKGLGDTINYLDDNTQAKVGEIIDVMKRMGSFADKLGASNSAAYASTLLSLGETNETAGTSMKAIVTKLSAAEKGTKHFQSAMQELGLSTSAVQKGMAEDANKTIQTVLDAVNKMPKDKQTGILKELFGLEHVGQAGKLANNLGELRKQIEMTQAAAAKGSMDKEVEARLKTLGSRWETFSSTVTNALAKIGEAVTPHIGPLLDKISALTERMGNFAQRHPRLTAAVLTSIAVVGGLTVGLSALALGAGLVLSPFARLISMYAMLSKWNTLASGVTRLGTAFGAVSKAVGIAGRFMMANPILMAVMVIAGAAYLIYRNWDKIGPYFQKVWDKVKSVFTTTFHVINGLFIKFPILNYIFPIVGAILFLIRNWHNIVPAVKQAWERTRQYVHDGVNKVKSIINNLAIVQWFRAIWNAAMEYLSGLGSRFMQLGSDIVSGLWNGLKAKWDAVSGWLKEKMTNLLTLSKASLDSRSPSRKFIQLGKDIMLGLGIGIQDKAGSAIGATLAAVQKIKGAGVFDFDTPKLAGLQDTVMRKVKPFTEMFRGLMGRFAPTLALAGAGGGGSAVNGGSIQPKPTFNPARSNKTVANDNSVFQITINATPNQSPQEIARAVQAELSKAKRQEQVAVRSRMYHND